MYQGRKFGCNFGVGATSGRLLGHLYGANPVGSHLRIIAPIARCRESEYSHFLPNLGIKSLTSVSLTMPFHVKPECPRHLVTAYEGAVNALPASFLLPPASGEVFNYISAYESRLRGYSLAEGFDVVLTGGGTR
jgi:hypothetical protein